ncbi:MAG: hypothetical protein ACJAUW_000850 [Yoonia sp.]|jgi:uncharacterized protein YkwD
MKTGFIALILLPLAGCVVYIPPPGEATPASVTRTLVLPTTDFGKTYNAFRTSQGLGPLQDNAILTRAALAHALDMENRGYFSHSSVGGPNGRDLEARANAAGCNIRAGAENIAQGQKSEQEVFADWRDSPGHRVNLLGPRYTDYGLGRAGDTWVMKLSSGC